MQHYTHGENVDDNYIDNIYSFVKSELQELIEKYPKRLQVHVFPHFMTASYIGVDIPFDEQKKHTLLHSMIEVTQYQYFRGARASPITYFHPDRDKDHFLETVDSIREMWDESKKFPEDTSAQK